MLGTFFDGNLCYFHYYCSGDLGPLRLPPWLSFQKYFNTTSELKGQPVWSFPSLLSPIFSPKWLRKWNAVNIWFRDNLWPPNSSVLKISSLCWPLLREAGGGGGWGRVWFQVSKGLERFGSNVGSPEVSLQASFSSVSFLPSFYEKGEGTVLLALTDAPELNILSWCPEGGEIRYRCFFLDVRDRSNITRMKLFAQCPAPGGTQYTELFFLFLWEATCLWKKEINMLYEQFSSPAGHRDVPESPALPCLKIRQLYL